MSNNIWIIFMGQELISSLKERIQLFEVKLTSQQFPVWHHSTENLSER